MLIKEIHETTLIVARPVIDHFLLSTRNKYLAFLGHMTSTQQHKKANHQIVIWERVKAKNMQPTQNLSLLLRKVLHQGLQLSIYQKMSQILKLIILMKVTVVTFAKVSIPHNTNIWTTFSCKLGSV